MQRYLHKETFHVHTCWWTWLHAKISSQGDISCWQPSVDRNSCKGLFTHRHSRRDLFKNRNSSWRRTWPGTWPRPTVCPSSRAARGLSWRPARLSALSPRLSRASRARSARTYCGPAMRHAAASSLSTPPPSNKNVRGVFTQTFWVSPVTVGLAPIFVGMSFRI